jgi:glycosyltransferase involved in cell wall biosynthesis
LIIPVYNNAVYLKDCLNSVKSQSFSQFEAILINDGSEDASLDICESCAAEDDRFVIINQQHQGVSQARNSGIKAAQGQYLAFADADDILMPTMLEELYSAAKLKGADIVSCAFRLIEPQMRDEFFRLAPELQEEPHSKRVMRLIHEHPIYNSMWNKLYSAELIESREIAVPEGIVIGEDSLFNLMAYYYSRNSVYLDKVLYIYNYRQGSAIHTKENQSNRLALLAKRCELAQVLNIKESAFASLAEQFYSLLGSEFNKIALPELLKGISRARLSKANKDAYNLVWLRLYPLSKQLAQFKFRAQRKYKHIVKIISLKVGKK